jgi:sugar phosphate isomerase/epimerase
LSRIPISIQHFSVKNSATHNLEGTLNSLKTIGFDAIEFFGPFTLDAKNIDVILKNSGLFCSGWHVEISELIEDKIQATIEYNQRIGNTMLIMPRLPNEMINSYATIAGPTRDYFYSLTEKMNHLGFDIGFHPHLNEFIKLPDADCSIWEAIHDNSPDNFVMQFDTGNCMEAGCDPVTELLKVVHRVKTIHLKPFSRSLGTNATIGHDDIDLDSILPLARAKCGTKMVVIEYEGAGDELKNASLCFNSLVEYYEKYLIN